MKPHYFNQAEPDPDDIALQLAIKQGWVPTTCLLGGELVQALALSGADPCSGCAGPRERCHGGPEFQ